MTDAPPPALEDDLAERLTTLEIQVIEQDHRVVPVLARFIAEFIDPRSWLHLASYLVTLPVRIAHYLARLRSRREATVDDGLAARRRIAIATAAARLLVGPSLALTIGAGLTTAVASVGVWVAYRQHQSIDRQSALIARQTYLATFEQTSRLRTLLFRPPNDDEGNVIEHYYQRGDDISRWPPPNPSQARQIASFGIAEPQVAAALRPLLADDAASVASGALLALALLHRDYENAGPLNARGARLPLATLDSLVLDGVDLEAALMGGVLARGTLFKGASLVRAGMEGAFLSGARMEDARLVEVNANGADFSYANLSRATLSNGKLASAKLVGTDLREANLVDVDLRDADLEGARLQGSNLERADLRGASLLGVGDSPATDDRGAAALIPLTVKARAAKVWASALTEEDPDLEEGWRRVLSSETVSNMCVYGRELSAMMSILEEDSIARARLQAVADVPSSLSASECSSLTSSDGRVIMRVPFDGLGADLMALDAGAIQLILEAEPGSNLLIEGHTDERGTAEYNFAISARLADNVKRFLVERGLDRLRIRSRGLGETQPRVQGDNEDAWTQNRRVELSFSQ